MQEGKDLVNCHVFFDKAKSWIIIILLCASSFYVKQKEKGSISTMQKIAGKNFVTAFTTQIHTAAWPMIYDSFKVIVVVCSSYT